MIWRLLGLLLLALVLAPQKADAQPWSGILAPARAIDWSTAGVTGGIPTNRPVCTTLNPGATAAQINTALNSAPCQNGVVMLTAGTYTLSSGLQMRSNVTLRGAGMSTNLNFTGQGGVTYYWAGADVAIAFQATNFDSSGDPQQDPVGRLGPGQAGVPASTVRSWVGTNGQAGVYTQGATVINLSSAPTGLSVGDTLTIWQTDAASGTLPSSAYFVSEKCCTGTGDISWKGTSAGYSRGQTQRSRVVAINGSAVTIAAPGLTRPTGTFATGNTPRAGWQLGTIKGAGLEYLRVTRTGSHNETIGLNSAADSWILGVGVTGTVSAASAITIRDSRNITVKDSWIDRITGGGGGQFTSYGFSLIQMSHSLFENNILNQVESPWIINAGSTGNVFAYNYENFSAGEGGMQQHEFGAAMNLFEGNATIKFWMDTIHGNTQLDTFFRNYTSSNVGFDIWTYNRWYAFIGNVLSGAAQRYKTDAMDAFSTLLTRFGTDSQSANIGFCFRFGYGSQYQGTAALPAENHDPADVGSSNQARDALVNTTAMLWGNWCGAGASTRFLASEVPSADPIFPNPVPATQVLPPSFYYAARPTWWSAARAWPPIGPDVTGGNISGLAGHAYRLPAQDCFTTASGTIAQFNPTTCYVASVATGPPVPPSDLVTGPAFFVTVTKAGSGTGTVTGPGINCGTTCTHPYTVGDTVTLTAAPSGGATFTGWSGDCTGTGTCTVTMNQPRAATATFTSSALYTVQVSAAADRSNNVDLNGYVAAPLSNIYVFTRPVTGVTQVRFFLDDPTMANAPIHTEGTAEYDFAGTAGDGTALPFDTSTIATGTHTITAAVDLSAGGTNVVSASFTSTTTPAGPVTISWTDTNTSPNETGTEIYYCRGLNCTVVASPATLAGTVGANITTFTHTAAPGGRLGYAVRAVDPPTALSTTRYIQ